MSVSTLQPTTTVALSHDLRDGKDIKTGSKSRHRSGWAYSIVLGPLTFESTCISRGKKAQASPRLWF